MTGNCRKRNITASICSHTCLLFTGRKARLFSALKLQVSKRMSIYLTGNCVSKLWWIVMLRVHCKVFHQISINKMGLSPSVDIYVYAAILMVPVRRRDQIQKAGVSLPSHSSLKVPTCRLRTSTWAVHNTGPPSIIIILTFVQVVCHLWRRRLPLYDKVPYAGRHWPWLWSPI